jgi:glyoxylase-like metal-dependent hydrolase (beta-lactamase superfamily II)
MKRLHVPGLYGWSRFHEPLNIDFNSLALDRAGGAVLVDPLPLSAPDEAEVRALGPVAWIVVTNADHARATGELAARLGARVAGPLAERGAFPLACDRWLADGDEVAPGVVARTLDGSKTPGELALVLEETTLITGDLVRAHRPNSLTWLLPPKLKDGAAARASLARLLGLHPRVDAVLVGDGWPMFAHAGPHLAGLVAG